MRQHHDDEPSLILIHWFCSVCSVCAVKRSFSRRVICLSSFVLFVRSFARSLIRCGLLGFVGVYGCHSEWVNSIFAFDSNIRTFAKSFVHSFLACVLSVHGNVIYISYTFCLCSSWLGSLVGWLESLEMYKIEPTIHSTHTERELAYQAAMHVVWSERLETRNSEFLSSVFTRFIFAALALWLERFLLVKLFSAPPPHVHMCVLCVCLMWMFECF